ncbi:hypothetical protein BaRGS_00003906 [Batillaria attramentaria]|uniref:Cytochrome P450 n=1 Tax=Batillaria attramentaria TaxID=370345 RepID=A0ABD0LZI0_9CAEN
MEILGLVDIPVWVLLLVLLFTLLYLYGTWTYSTWSSVGIPGPRPVPLLGNNLQTARQPPHKSFEQWLKMYGRVFGIYQGVRPQLVVTDLDLLREIMVKNFSNFVDRHFIPGLRPPVVDKGVFFARGTTWKRIRNMMTPTFSTSKLKLMCHYINRCSQLLSENIKQKTQNQEVVDVKDVFGSFTMDVIAGTAFGLETNSQTQDAEPFVFHMKRMFQRLSGGFGLAIQIATAFPFLGPVFGKLGMGAFGNEHTQFFMKALDGIIESRKNGSTRDEADADAITDRAEDSDDTKTHRRMTKDEILGQGFLVLIAGYETTATTLQYLAYNLTMHPDVQQKVVDEIREKLGDADPTYENVASLTYLDAAIHETLRLFPPVPLINRQAAETITLRGFTIPAGCGVTIPIYQILHDSEYFSEPEKFMPDRFCGENRSKVPALAIELAFGYGPRQCIGMRLALLEIKFAAVRIFRHFRFLKCDDTPDQVKLTSQALTVPDKPIKVKTELRDA